MVRGARNFRKLCPRKNTSTNLLIVVGSVTTNLLELHMKWSY
jgi:hypothetical protein